MPLPSNTYAVQLRRGLDTKTNTKAVIAGKLLVCENGIFTQPGVVAKRLGYTPLGTLLALPIVIAPTPVASGSTQTTIGSSTALMVFNNELLQTTANTLYSYNATATNWINRGAAYSTLVTQKPITRNTSTQISQDSTTHPQGIEVYAYEDSGGGARYSVIDTATGQFVINNAVLNSNATKVKVFSIASNVIILYFNSSDTRLYLTSIQVTTPTNLSTPIALTTTGGVNAAVNPTNPNYDACVIGTTLYIAFNSNNSTTTIFKSNSSNPSVINSQVSVAFDSGPSLALTLFPDVVSGGVVWAGADASTVRLRVWDSALQTAQLRTVDSIANCVLITGVTQLLPIPQMTLFYTVSATQTYNYFTKKALFTQTNGPLGTLLWIGGSFMPYTSPGYLQTSTTLFTRSVAIAGKAFLYANTPVVPFVYQSPLQPTYFFIDTNGTIAGKVLSGIAGGIPVRSAQGAAMLPESNLVGTQGTQFQFSFLSKSALTAASGTVLTQSGVQSTVINFNDPSFSYLRLSAGSTLLLSGGVPSIYDGQSVIEHNFLLFPEPVTASTSTTGGTINAGSYQYIALYTWIDNQGILHRSSPSIATSLLTTTGSTSSNTVTVPTLRITEKTRNRGPVSIEIYRNAGETGGTVFYQVTSPTAPLQNSVAVDTVTFVDTSSDASIIGNNLLYTTGGIVIDGPMNPCSSLTIHRNRVWALDSSNPLVLFFSKTVIPGTTPVEFSPFFTYSIDSKGGPATAVASLDEKLIVFRKDTIGFTYGDGPDNTGNGSFADLVPIVGADTGTTNPKSIVVMPRGLMFDSPKGKYLLTRGLTLEYIGADVEAFNGIQVTSAQLIPTTNQVRFGLANGTILIYDYLVNEWSVHTPILNTDSVIWKGTYTYLRTDGTVLQETPGLFLDAGLPIKLRLTTSWLQFAGIMGFKRCRKIYVLGEQTSPHTLQLSLAFNFDPSVTQQSTLVPTTPTVFGSDATFGSGSPFGGGFPLYQFRIDPTVQLTEAIQLSIEDISNTGSLNILAVLVEAGVKQGGFKLPATAQA